MNQVPRPLPPPPRRSLYFFIYSTWEGLALYLEDVYVQPEHRGKRVGASVISKLASSTLPNNMSSHQSFHHLTPPQD